jgi:siroheme synthase-like protein
MNGKPLFPIALTLDGRLCVVIGPDGDREVKQKTEMLIESGAIVKREQDYRAFRDQDIAGAFFVLSAVRDREFSLRLERLSKANGFLLWCVDQPQYGCVSMMAIAKSGPVRLAASTSGVAPSVSKAFRKALERAMDPTFARFVAQLGALRASLRERLPHDAQASQRIDAMLDASRNFDVRVSFRYPDWFNP